MFTGIISATTKLRVSHTDNSGMTLTFDRPTSWNDLMVGDSIATNGTCLTIAAVRASEYDCVVVPETLERTTFGKQLPEIANLERSLTLNDRLDGHIVQGHVDSIGQVEAIDDHDGLRMTISFDPANQELIIYKGSITVDGVALTVSHITRDKFEIALIPHTLSSTTLHSLKVGDKVNLEFDVIGKYVVNSLKKSRPAS